MADKVEIHAPDAAWPDAFRAEKAAIEGVLKRPGLRFEHVGSTAVPGLAAKATIDVMIGTADGAVDEAAQKAFESLGYKFLCEFGVPGRQLFRKGLPPTHHVHWTKTGGAFWEDQLLFRDFLRTHPGEAAAYEDLKRGLAAQFAEDRAKYTASKAEFITALIVKARSLKGARRIVFDLEATCWEQATTVDRQEIIEIGAVELGADLSIKREYRAFVRPTREPRLSDFCVRLLNIRQADVDAAMTFGPALDAFAAWIGPAPFELCSWGAYDLTQIVVECGRLARSLPPGFERHVDLQALFSRAKGVKAPTTEAALELCGLEPAGSRHRALDDARQIARLAAVLLQ